MVQNESTPEGFSLKEAEAASITLTNKEGFGFEIVKVSSSIIRVRFTGGNHALPIHDNVVSPLVIDSSGTSFPISFKAKGLKSVQAPLDDFHSFTLSWSVSPILTISNSFGTLYADIPIRAYSIDGPGIAHYTRHTSTSAYFGLGERAAPLNAIGRTFTLSALDSAEYDPYFTDPLYKQNPFLITVTFRPATKKVMGVIGQFYTSNSRGTWSIGNEKDAFWGDYNVYRQDHGGLEEFLIVGRSVRDVVEKFMEIVGTSPMVPRWWLGYLGSTMGLGESDDPPAQELLSGFIKKCREHDIPISAMHLSSGYTVSEVPPHTRNVFTLNRHRFPDLPGLMREYHSQGIKVSANVKPWLLATHPSYKKLIEKGGYFQDETGALAVSRLWSAANGESEVGSWIDFTSKAGREFWQDGVKTLLDLGIDAIWDDNNEFSSLVRDDWTCAADFPRSTGRKTIGEVGRLRNTQLMVEASRAEMERRQPRRRHFILSRSANQGVLRSTTSTWSGDNKSSWEVLKGNISMGINAGLSGYHCYGHDIGGFGGPLPSPLLFLRWVQVSVYHTRFCIHSYKPSANDPSGQGTVNTPWMHPAILPQIRKEIKRRYELMPYLYDLIWDSHLRGIPPVRWIGWGFEEDENVWTKDVMQREEFWCGDGLLIAGVFEEDIKETTVYLPKMEKDQIVQGYYSLSGLYDKYEAGKWVTVQTSNYEFPVFARFGAVVPIGKDGVTVASLNDESMTTADGSKILLASEGGRVSLDDWRGLEIYPPPPESSSGQHYSSVWKEDAGERIDFLDNHAEIRIHYSAEIENVQVWGTVKYIGDFKPLWGNRLDVILPRGDSRAVVGPNGQKRSRKVDNDRRRVYNIELSVL